MSGVLIPCPTRDKTGTDRGHDVIRLGGETAVVVPVHEYHTLKALRDRASAEQVEEAEIDAAIAEHEAWKAAGRPGLKSHDEFMAEVFGGSR